MLSRLQRGLASQHRCVAQRLAPAVRPAVPGTSRFRRFFGSSAKDRENWTEEQWGEWNELDEMEKLRRDPSMYSSPLATDSEATSERLLDDAWVIDPAKREGTVIWLHGIGEGMKEAQKIFEMLAPKNLRIVVPKAPFIPVTALDEEEQNTWYDLESAVFSDDVDEDYRGINESAEKVRQLLDEEIQLVPSERIIVAGFAQGGALAIHAGLQYSLPLGGILSFAGYVALPEDLPEVIHPANKGVKVLAVHGNSDQVIPIEFAKSRYEVLKREGVPLELREDFYLEHCTSEQTLFEMLRWFEEQVALKGRRG